ncbi:MAG: hypothetical protein ACLFV7_07650, partial [Phycisphaerae bacterium]
MKRISILIVMLAVVAVPLGVFAAEETGPSEEAVNAAYLKAGTDKEVQKQLAEQATSDGKSGAYASDATPVAEKVEVTVGGETETVTVYREQTD